MKKIVIALAAALMMGSIAQAQEPHFKIYGFIRNYFTYDTRENVAGTEDFFEYVPKDKLMSDGTDLNEEGTFRFAALTSRVGLDVLGYQVLGWNIGAKVETDFYAGLTGNTGTATLRLRQAFLTMSKKSISLKMGQAWHPMAADLPDVLSLNSGSPFNPFSRTPEVIFDYKISDSPVTLTAAAIWQMQYTSTGPDGAKADYIKYGATPEFYFGVNYKSAHFLGRLGVDVLSIKPRHIGEHNGTKVKVDDRITTVSPFIYLQYTKDKFAFKAKSIFAQAGEHMNLNGGYGVTKINEDGSWEYDATRNSSSWVSVSYGKKFKGNMFLGYVKNLGTSDKLIDNAEHFWFSKNSFKNLNSLLRVSPSILYNMGKLGFGLEYEITSARYGSFGADDHKGLAKQGVHPVTNHRLQAMVKFTF